MNAVDILRYGHRTIQGSIEGLSEEDWYTQGVAGHCPCWPTCPGEQRQGQGQ